MSVLALRARGPADAALPVRRRGRAAALAGAIALAACASAPPVAPPTEIARSAQADWSARYAALAAGGGSVLRLDPQRSTVRILVFRGGRAPRLGHNHVLTTPAFTGFVFVPAAGYDGTQFDLEFRLDALQIDPPAERAALGAAFAAEVTPGDIAGTRAHMLGEENLQADRYPFVRIHGKGIAGEGEHFSAEVTVEMHGQQRTMAVPLVVSGLPGQVRATGTLVLRQGDFGIRPYSVLGGLIAVQDAVIVEFTLVGG